MARRWRAIRRGGDRADVGPGRGLGPPRDLRDGCAGQGVDRGLDGGPLRQRLWDEHRIRPLIDVREMWREEKAEPGHDASKAILHPLSADGGGNVLHSEKGEVFCRCPAATYGLERMGREAYLSDAGSQASDYGRVVRIGLEGRSQRTFTPVPWGSPSWRRGHARRSALERVNARLDNNFGFERHFVRGRPPKNPAPQLPRQDLWLT